MIERVGDAGVVAAVVPLHARRQIALGIISVYLGMTALWTLFIWLTGLTVFDAVAHAMTTIATGGLATVVIPHCRTIDHHEPFLTLEGLRLVHEKNVDD